MLEIRNISVDLGEQRILEDVALEVGKNEIVAILGPSGSGKSTLLRAVAGLIPLAGGSILWEGRDMAGVPVHKRGFGLMFQGFALFPHLDVGRNVGFGVEGPDSSNRVATVLDMVGLPGFERRSIADLSGGEKQRVALARTLAPEPDLVMLDEPMGALDRNLREKLVNDTRQVLLNSSATALIVTHDREEAARLADRLALMRQGQIVQTGTLDAILAKPADPWVSDFLA